MKKFGLYLLVQCLIVGLGYLVYDHYTYMSAKRQRLEGLGEVTVEDAGHYWGHGSDFMGKCFKTVDVKTQDGRSITLVHVYGEEDSVKKKGMRIRVTAGWLLGSIYVTSYGWDKERIE